VQINIALREVGLPYFVIGNSNTNVGGCSCDCSWASSLTCSTDDNSCCFSCCCGTGVVPTPAPSPLIRGDLYCPSSTDLLAAYSEQNVKLFDQGWSVRAGGAAATKASFNLLGGYVEYDVDFSQVETGVNANIYTLSPQFKNKAFDQSSYCDGQQTGANFCVEVDWVETNGDCGGATALHTTEGHTGGCDASGCTVSYFYGSKPSYHMRIEYAADGTLTTTRDGSAIYPSDFNPQPGQTDWSAVSGYYSSRGAVIYSSQWTGWVPVSSTCGRTGNLDASSFTVKNLRIFGSVVQGPLPRLCS
jgi:hypothetical protein